MTEETSLEDIEWMLAKASGFNAGFGFVCSYEALEKNGQTEEILNQIKIWESARFQGLFNESSRENLRDVSKEFHLEKTGDGEFELTEINSFKAEHTKKEKQPGEPLFSSMQFSTEVENQTLSFIMKAVDGDIDNISLEFDNYRQLEFSITLHEGDVIKYSGGNTASIYDNNWHKIKELNLEPLSLSTGEHIVAINCNFIRNENAKLKIEVRIPSSKEKILINK